jgi:hypothetical protein
MQFQQAGELCILNRSLLLCQDRNELEHILEIPTVDEALKEAVFHLLSDIVQFVAEAAREDENLVSTVRDDEVLNVDWPTIGGAEKDLRRHSLTNNEVLSKGLVGIVDNG